MIEPTSPWFNFYTLADFYRCCWWILTRKRVKHFYKKVKNYFWAKQSHALIFFRGERCSKTHFFFFSRINFGCGSDGVGIGAANLGWSTVKVLPLEIRIFMVTIQHHQININYLDINQQKNKICKKTFKQKFQLCFPLPIQDFSSNWAVHIRQK